LAFHFCLENYLQRTSEKTNKDKHENDKEKISSDLKVTEDLENRDEISVDRVGTLAHEMVSVEEDRSQCDLKNSNNSAKKKPKNERISKKENQKIKMEQKKEEGI
jgi:hypothetical protein